VGIASDPAVLFADDFESYTTPADAKARWLNGSGLNYMRIATEAAHVFSGKKAIEFALPVSTTEISCALVRKLSPERDTVFMRMYQKFDASYSTTGSNHNGIYLGAHSPGTAGSIPPPDGTGWFSFTLQNDNTRAGTVAPGPTELYVYWRGQATQFGDHWLPSPTFTPQRDRWYCYELMVKANTPGQSNGEAKFWIDGVVKGDFTNLNLRSIPTVTMDVTKIVLHANKVVTPLTKWHDNVVIATSYIGPMKPKPSPTATPSPTPTATQTPTPSPIPTASPTATPSTVSVIASWQSTQGDSYKVYYGIASGQYATALDAGPSDSFMINGLLPNTTYYFALSAVRNGAESPKSPETVYKTTTAQLQNLKLGAP